MKQDKKGNNSGTVLVWTMMAITLLMGSVAVGMVLLENTINTLNSQMEYYGQATSIAKAGILDTLAWFRRQTNQPVTLFDPKLDLVVIPSVNDTDDPNIGIVRELEVAQSRNLYGRYEVNKTIVADISAQRGLVGTGTIWYIESHGYIYKKLDPAKPYNVLPNEVVAKVKLGTEIRRVSMVLPAQAALCAGNPNQTNIGNNTKIMGGTQIGIVYPPGEGTPNINPGATVTGTLSATSVVSPYNESTVSVFGMTETELRSIADYYVTQVSELPNPIPDYKIVFFDGNPSFNSSHPLKGTGIFYCTGNMDIAANSGSSYNGIIYCKGNYVQAAPSIIYGSVVALRLCQVLSTGDISEIDYDAGILQQIQIYTGQYRLAKGMYEVK